MPRSSPTKKSEARQEYRRRAARKARQQLTFRLDPTGEVWDQVKDVIERYADPDRDQPHEGSTS